MMLLAEGEGGGGGSQHQRVGRGLIFPSFERITKLALKKSGEGGGEGGGLGHRES